MSLVLTNNITDSNMAGVPDSHHRSSNDLSRHDARSFYEPPNPKHSAITELDRLLQDNSYGLLGKLQ